MKFSLVMPYRQRLENIGMAFASLAEQTLDHDEFEVVVGCMEHSPEYIALCDEFADRLDIVTVAVAADAEWNISRARNLALRQVRGDVVVLLDCDMVIPADFLSNLWEHYYQHGQQVCVCGQMIGYDEAVDRDVAGPSAQSWEVHRQTLADLAAADRTALDCRWSERFASAVRRYPWAYVRGGIFAVPAGLLHRHGLTFDENFRGWGPEDQEWAYRVAATGVPFVMAPDVYGLHLPHRRSTAENGSTAVANNRYYLSKWPYLGLELAMTFGGWIAADTVHDDAERELAAAVSGPQRTYGVARGPVGGVDTLVVGVELDRNTTDPAPEHRRIFDGGAPVEVLPLAGFALPFEDDGIERCRVLPAVSRLRPRFRDAIFGEANRVARTPPAVDGRS
ncbi:glycosyltransferase [Dactylosporangium sp. CA-139114]|uniref:glycosyltransferase n=1 Tax=Dactylosporangium sp. CA-139114 TaxID=3239931 RepID=UPI003D99DF51